MRANKSVARMLKHASRKRTQRERESAGSDAERLAVSLPCSRCPCILRASSVTTCIMAPATASPPSLCHALFLPPSSGEGTLLRLGCLNGLRCSSEGLLALAASESLAAACDRLRNDGRFAVTVAPDSPGTVRRVQICIASASRSREGELLLRRVPATGWTGKPMQDDSRCSRTNSVLP